MTGGGSGGPRWRVYREPRTDDVQRETTDPEGRPLAEADPGPSTPRRARRRPAVAAVVATLALGIGGYLVADGQRSDVEATAMLPDWRPRPVLHREVVDRIVDRIVEDTGSADVLELTATRGTSASDPEAARPYSSIFVTVPPTGEGRFGDLALTYQYMDDELVDQEAREPVLTEAFDLREIDLAMLADLQDMAVTESGQPLASADVRIGQPDWPYESWLIVAVTETDRDEVEIEALRDGTCQLVRFDDEQRSERTEEAC